MRPDTRTPPTILFYELCTYSVWASTGRFIMPATCSFPQGLRFRCQQVYGMECEQADGAEWRPVWLPSRKACRRRPRQVHARSGPDSAQGEFEPRRREPAAPPIAPPRRQRVHQPHPPAALGLAVGGRGGGQGRDAVPRSGRSPRSGQPCPRPPRSPSRHRPGPPSRCAAPSWSPARWPAEAPRLLRGVTRRGPRPRTRGPPAPARAPPGSSRSEAAAADIKDTDPPWPARPGRAPGTTAGAGRMHPPLRLPRQATGSPGHPARKPRAPLVAHARPRPALQHKFRMV
jgi:hypothetical protein